MLLANQKKEENIAEYVIYMYHIEDVIRAMNFDIDAIVKNYVEPQLHDKAFVNQYREWFLELIQQMHQEKIEKSGHLRLIQETIDELGYLHNMLQDSFKEENYINLYNRTLPVIEDFSHHANLVGHNPIEIAFHSQYMKLLMRLKKDEISAETEKAFDAMRVYLAYLAKRYREIMQQSREN